jgi:hypothetical protein
MDSDWPVCNGARLESMWRQSEETQRRIDPDTATLIFSPHHDDLPPTLPCFRATSLSDPTELSGPSSSRSLSAGTGGGRRAPCVSAQRLDHAKLVMLSELQRGRQSPRSCATSASESYSSRKNVDARELHSKALRSRSGAGDMCWSRRGQAILYAFESGSKGFGYTQ